MDPTKPNTPADPSQPSSGFPTPPAGDNNPLGGLTSSNPVANDLGAGNTTTSPLNPEMPQSLNTSTPTEMPAGDPMPPVGNSDSGLPAQLPNTGASKPGGSHKMIIGIIILLVLAILGVGGYYFYVMQATPEETSTNQTTPNQTVEDLNGIESELETVEVTDPAGDMVVIDQEINLLEATPSSSKSPLSR